MSEWSRWISELFGGNLTDSRPAVEMQQWLCYITTSCSPSRMCKECFFQVKGQTSHPFQFQYLLQMRLVFNFQFKPMLFCTCCARLEADRPQTDSGGCHSPSRSACTLCDATKGRHIKLGKYLAARKQQRSEFCI